MAILKDLSARQLFQNGMAGPVHTAFIPRRGSYYSGMGVTLSFTGVAAGAAFKTCEGFNGAVMEWAGEWGYKIQLAGRAAFWKTAQRNFNNCFQ